jgi:uncharacterized membrane protein YcaP (DUF421 family)
MATKANKEEQINEQEVKKEKTSKQPIQHEKLNKECNNVPYKEITKEDMVNYILEYAPKDKKWFKQVIEDNIKADKNGKERINYISIKRAFCERYNPSLIPTAKKKQSILDMVKDW